MKCGKWEFIAKSLLSGYSKNIFVSMKELQEKTHHFMRYEDETHIAVLDSKSTLARSKKESPVSIVLARDIVYLTAIRSTAIISFLGEVKLEWLTHHVERRIKLEIEEENYLIKKNIFEKAKTIFSKDISMNIDNQLIYLKGPTAVVLKAELHFLQELIIEKKFYLDNNNPKNTTNYENLSRNLISVTKMPHIFRTMIWRWEAQKQVKITINPNISSETCQIIIKGRYAHIAKVEAEFDSFLYWLQKCVVIRHPNAGVSPRLVCPQMRDQCKEIEKRIARVTDPERTSVDLYNNVKGREATRETRMEVVAWISICKHNCKLEGGFVRDWIVGKTIQRPEHLLNNPHDWFDYETNNKNERIPRMNPQVVPSDLDFHLPTHFGFDIDQFQDELYKLGIECTVYRQSWRYVLLIDEYSPTGPFTIDFIEPHITLTYDRIDSDVSNFFLERNYTRDIGMRIDIQQKPYSIKLEIILDNIKNKSFQILRPIDKYLTDRINKMIHIRGWTQLGEPFSIIPEPHRHSYSLLVPLHYTSVLYQDLAQKMKSINTSLRIISIEEVKNPFLEDAYEAMKNIIAKQCTGFNPNERELFHGTKDAAIKGITEDGYDDRYFDKNGAWGHGAYFADDPKKSHNYTALDPNEHTHVMFYNKVLLGNQQVLQDIDQTLVSAPVGYHSIKGTKFQYTEYIIYRYGQALPYLKIIYKP